MTPDQAADLAARTRSAIPGCQHDKPWDDCVWCADRERVESDLAGLRHCQRYDTVASHADHARRYADGLRRTAALYGVSTSRS